MSGTDTDRSPAVQGEGRMSLYDHLAELRRRLIISVGAVVVGTIVGLVFQERIFNFLSSPYCELPSRLQTVDDEAGSCGFLVTKPLEEFSTILNIALYSGVALAMPVILWQIWKFIVPGLYAHERRYGLTFVASGFLLFLLGVSLAYWSVPRALVFLTEIGGDRFVTAFSPKDYLNFTLKMLVAFGLGFQFPILLIFLQLLGIVTTDQLRNLRRHAIVGIVILVAVITPSGDPITLLVLSVPLYIFYEVSIGFGLWRARKQDAVE